MADEIPIEGGPEKQPKGVPPEIKVVDPVTLAVLGRETVDAGGFTVRPQTAEKSFKINEKVLATQGITSADDPRFLQLHQASTNDYISYANAQAQKVWADYDDKPDSAFNVPTAGPPTTINLKKYLPSNMQTKAVKASHVANVEELWNNTEFGRNYDSYGRSYQTHTDEQIAEAKGTYQKKDGTLGSLDEYNVASLLGMPMKRKDDGSGDNGILVLGPGQQWEERDSDVHIQKAVIRSIYGPKEMTSGSMETLGSTGKNTLIDMSYGALGAYTEFLGGISKSNYEEGLIMASGGPVGVYSWYLSKILEGLFDPEKTIAFGSQLQNSAGLRQSKLSEQADRAGLFSAHGMAKLTGSAIPQALATFGAGSILGFAGRMTATALGATRAGAVTVGNAFARTASLGAGAGYAMHGMNDEAKAHGIKKEDRTWLMGMAGLATMLSEVALSKLGASGVVDGLLNRKDAAKIIGDRIGQAAREGFKAGVADFTKEGVTEAGKMAAGKNMIGSFMNKVFGGIGKLTGTKNTVGKQMVAAGLEESFEEMGEEIMNNVTKYGYDTFFSDEGSSAGKGQFGAHLLPTLEEMAGAALGGFIGGVPAAGISGMMHGVQPELVLGERWRAQIATTMKQDEAEQMIREEYQKNWFVAPKDKNGKDQLETAIQGELENMRLIYATKKEMGLDNPDIISKMMGGDSVLAQRGLELGMRKRRENAKVAELTAQAEKNPALVGELENAKAAVEHTDKQIQALMSGEVYAKSQMAMLLDAHNVKNDQSAAYLKELEKNTAENKDKEEKDKTKMKSYSNFMDSAIDEYENNHGQKIGDIEKLEETLKLGKRVEELTAERAKKKELSQVEVKQHEEAIAQADMTTKQGLHSVLSSLKALSTMNLTAEQAATYEDNRKNASKASQDLSVDMTPEAEKMLADIEALDPAAANYNEEVEKLTASIGADNYYEGMEAEEIAEMLYEKKMKADGLSSISDTPMSVVPTDDRRVILKQAFLPDTMTLMPGVVEVSRKAWEDGHIEGVEVTEVSAEGLEILRSLSDDGTGRNIMNVVSESINTILKNKTSGALEKAQGEALLKSARDNYNTFVKFAILARAAAKGKLHDKAKELLGVNNTYYTRISNEFHAHSEVLNKLEVEKSVAKTDAEKIEVQAKIDALPVPELQNIEDLLRLQIQSVLSYMDQVSKYTDTYKEDQARIRKVDIIGRKHLANTLLQHQEDVDMDTVLSIAGVSVRYGDLAINTKKEEDLTMVDALAAQQWWHIYFHTKKADGSLPILKDGVRLEIQKGLKEPNMSLDMIGQAAIDWRDFTEAHIKGEDLDGLQASKMMRIRYFMTLLQGTMAADPVATWKAMEAGTKEMVNGKPIFPHSPSHEQLLSVEVLLSLEAERMQSGNANHVSVMKQFKQLYAALDTGLDKASQKREYNAKALLLTGNAGAGKTSVSFTMYLLAAKKLGYISKDRKIVLIGHNADMLSPLVRAAEMAGIPKDWVKGYDSYAKFAIEKTKHIAAGDHVIVDEYSLLTYDQKKDMTEMVNSAIGGIMWMGDTSQAPPELTQASEQNIATWGFLPPMNLSFVHRTGVESISLMQSEIRNALYEPTGCPSFTKFSFGTQFKHFTPNTDESWSGNKHYASQDEMAVDVVKRLTGNDTRGYVVVMHKGQMAYWEAKGVPVKCISDLSTSPQGSERDEVWVDFTSFPADISMEDKKNELHKYLLTAISRAKKFLGVAGIDIRTKQMQVATESEVPNADTGKDLTKRAEERKTATEAHLAGISSMKTATARTTKTAKEEADEKAANRAAGATGSTIPKVADDPVAETDIDDEDIVDSTPTDDPIPTSTSNVPADTADWSFEELPSLEFGIGTPEEVVITYGHMYSYNGKQIGRPYAILKKTSKHDGKVYWQVIFDNNGSHITVSHDQLSEVKKYTGDNPSRATSFSATYKAGNGVVSLDTHYMTFQDADGITNNGDRLENRAGKPIDPTTQKMRLGVAMIPFEGKSIPVVILYEQRSGVKYVYAAHPYNNGDPNNIYKAGYAYDLNPIGETGGLVYEIEQAGFLEVDMVATLPQHVPTAQLGKTSGREQMTLKDHIEKLKALGFVYKRAIQKPNADGYSNKYAVYEHASGNTVEIELDTTAIDNSEVNSILNEMLVFQGGLKVSGNTLGAGDAVKALNQLFGVKFRELGNMMFANNDKLISQHFKVLVDGKLLSWAKAIRKLDSKNADHQMLAEAIYQQIIGVVTKLKTSGTDATGLLKSLQGFPDAPLRSPIGIQGDKKTLADSDQSKLLIANSIAVKGVAIQVKPSKGIANPSTSSTDDTVFNSSVDDDVLGFYTTDNEEARAEMDTQCAIIQKEMEAMLGFTFARRLTFAELGKLRNTAQGYIDANGNVTLESTGGFTSAQVAYHEATHFVVEFLLPSAYYDQVYAQAIKEMTIQGIPIKDKRSIAEYIAQKGERYHMDRRNLRGLNYVWRTLMDYIGRALRVMPFFRNRLQDVLFDMKYTTRFYDAPVVGVGIQDFDTPYLYSGAKFIDARMAEATIRKQIHDTSKRSQVNAALSQRVGAALFSPKKGGNSISDLTDIVWKISADYQRRGMEYLLNEVVRIDAQIANLKGEANGEVVYAADIIHLQNLKNELSGSLVTKVHKSDDKSLTLGYTYLIVVEKDGRKQLREYLHTEATRGDITILYSKGKDNKANIVVKNKIKGIERGWKVNEFAVQESIGKMTVQHDASGNPLSLRSIINKDGAQSLENKDLDLLTIYMMNNSKNRIGLWSSALMGIDVASMMQKGTTVTLNDLLEANRVVSDTVSKKESEEIHSTQRQSALFKLMLSSIRINRTDLDGNTVSEFASEVFMDTFILEMKTEFSDHTSDLWVDAIRKKMEEYAKARDGAEKDGTEASSASMMYQHAEGLLNFLKSHQENVKKFKDLDINGKGTLSDKEAEKIEKIGIFSEEILNAITVFYKSHVLQQAITSTWSGRGGMRTSISAAEGDAQILQNIKNGISNNFVDTAGETSQWVMNQQLEGLNSREQGAHKHKKEDKRPSPIFVRHEEGKWTLQYRYTSKKEGENEEQDISIASFENGNLVFNPILNTRQIDSAAQLDLLEKLFKHIGVRVTKKTIRLLRSTNMENNISFSQMPILKQLFIAALTAKHYTLSKGLDSEEQKDKRDWANELARLTDAMESSSAIGNYGKTEMNRAEIADTTQAEGEETGGPMNYHPLGVFRLLRETSRAKMMTDGGIGRGNHRGIHNQNIPVNQLSSQFDDALNRGQAALHKAKLAPIMKAARVRKLKSQHAVAYEFYTEAGKADGVHVFNPLLKTRNGIEIKRMLSFNGWKVGSGGRDLSGMTERDNLLQQESLIRSNLERLESGDTSVLIDVANQSNRVRQPIYEAILDQTGIGIHKTATGIEMGNGIYYKVGNVITIDSDNLLMQAAQHFLRILAAQRNSVNRHIGFFAQLYDESNKGDMWIELNNTSMTLRDFIQQDAGRLDWFNNMPDYIGDEDANDLKQWKRNIEDAKSWVEAGMDIFGSVLGNNPDLLQRYGSKGLRPTQDYMLVSGVHNDVPFKVAIPGIHTKGRSPHKIASNDRVVLFQDELTMSDVNTNVLIATLEDAQKEQVISQDFDWFSDENITLDTLDKSTVFEQAKTPKDRIAYAASLAHKKTLEAANPGASIAEIHALQKKDVQATIAALYKVSGEVSEDMIGKLVHQFDSSGWRVHKLVSEALWDKDQYTTSVGELKSAPWLIRQHLSKNGVVSERKDTSKAKSDRGRKRVLTMKDKFDDTTKPMSIFDLLLEHYMAGNSNGENHQLLDVNSQIALLKRLYKGGTKALGTKMKDLNWNKLDKDYDNPSLQNDLNDPESQLWLGHLLAHQFMNDAAMPLVYGDYTNYAKTELNMGSDNVKNVNTAIDPAKRILPASSTGFKAEIFSHLGLRQYSISMASRDWTMPHEFYGGSEYHFEDVNTTDGSAWMSPLDLSLSYHSQGGSMGAMNSISAVKSMNLQNNSATDEVEEQKYAKYPLAAAVRIQSKEMQTMFEYMHNPEGRPLVPEEFWEQVPPTSIFDQWVRLFTKAKTANPKASQQDLLEQADREMHRWYCAERGKHEARYEMMTDEQRATALPFPYKFIAQIQDQKDTSTSRALPFQSNTERLSDNGLVSIPINNGTRITADSFGELQDQIAALNAGVDWASLMTNDTEALFMALNTIPYLPLDQITQQKDNTQEILQLNTNKAIDSTDASPMVQQLSVLMSLSVNTADAPMIERIRKAWGEVMSQGLRDMVRDIAGIKENSTMDEIVNALQALPNDRLPRRLKELLKDEMSRTADTSMLSRLIQDDRVGIQFAGVQVRTMQLLAAHLRKDVLKQRMPAMRLTNAPGTSMEVFVWHDENGNTTTIPLSDQKWISDILGVDASMAEDGNDPQFLQDEVNGVVHTNKLIRRFVKPMTVQVDWARLKQQNEKAYKDTKAMWEKIENGKPTERGEAIEYAVSLGFGKVVLAENYAPNSVQSQYYIPQGLQPMHLFIWKDLNEEKVDMRSLFTGNEDRSVVRSQVAEQIESFMDILTPQYRISENGQIDLFNDEVAGNAFYEMNPFFDKTLRPIMQQLYTAMSAPKNVAVFQNLLEEAITAELEKSGLSDTAENRLKQLKNPNILAILKARAKEATEKVFDDFLNSAKEELDEEGNVVREKESAVAEVIHKLVDMVIGVYDTLEQIGTRTPSGPGSSIIYSTVGWLDNAAGSVNYGSAFRNASTGADHDADEDTLSRRPSNKWLLGRRAADKVSASEHAHTELFDSVFAIYKNPSTAMKLLQPISLKEWQNQATNVEDTILAGYNMPNSLIVDLAMRDSNMKGQLVGAASLQQKTTSLLHRSHEASNTAYLMEYVDTNKNKTVISWRTGDAYLPMQTLMEGLVNLGTDNPKLNVLGVLGINFENISSVVALMAQPDMVHKWMEDNFDALVLKEGMTDAEIASLREYYVVNSNDTVASRSKKIIRQVAKILTTDVAQKASKITEDKKGLGNRAKGDRTMYSALHVLATHLSENKQSMVEEMTSLESTDENSLTAKRTNMIEAIRNYISTTGATDIDGWNTMIERLSRGENIWLSSYFKGAAIELYKKIEKSVDLATNGSSTNLQEVKEKLMSIEGSVFTDSEEYLVGLLTLKEDIKQSMKAIYKAYFGLKKAERTEQYINKTLSPAYENTLQVLMRASISGEFLRRFQDVANLNQGIPNEPHKKWRLIRSLSAMTGISNKELLTKLKEMIDEIELSNLTGEDIDKVIERTLSVPGEERKTKEQRIKDVENAITNQHKHRAAQEGYQYLRQSVSVGGIIFDYASALSQQGDSLNAILASADSRAYMKALIVDTEMNNQLWLINNPVMQEKFEKMLYQTGNDDISEAAYSELYQEWDKAMVAHWLEQGGMDSQQMEATALIRKKGKDGKYEGSYLQVGDNGASYRVDVTTVTGRDTLVLQLGSTLESKIEAMRETIQTHSNGDLKYLFAELQSMDIGGSKHITLTNTSLYNKVQEDRLRSGLQSMDTIPGGKNLRELMELYQVLRFGFGYREVGGLSKIITTNLHAKYTKHIDMVVIPMLKDAAYAHNQGMSEEEVSKRTPAILLNFWTQVLDKTNIKGLLRYGVKADDGSFVPPICAYGYVEHYVKNVSAGGTMGEGKDGLPKMGKGIYIPVHVEVQSVGHTVFTRNSKGENVIQVGISKKKSILSPYSLNLPNGISVEAAWRMEEDIDMQKEKSWEDRMKDPENPQNPNDYYSNPKFQHNRWKQVIAGKDRSQWLKDREARLFEIYREALLSTKNVDVQKTMIDWVKRDLAGEPTIIADDSHVGNIGIYLTRWMQAAIAEAKRANVPIDWNTIAAMMSNTSVGTEPIQGAERYFVARIGVAETSYSSLNELSRLEVLPDGTNRWYSALAKEGKNNPTFKGLSEEEVVNIVRKFVVENIGLYISANVTIVDNAKKALGDDILNYLNMHGGMSALFESMSSHWREVRMDEGQMRNHLGRPEKEMTLQRKDRGLPYAIGDNVHFPDGSVGIVTHLSKPVNIARKGRSRNMVHSTIRYRLLPMKVYKASGEQQAKALIARLQVGLPVEVQFVSISDGYGSVSVKENGLPLVEMDATGTDAGVALHEWAHLWSAAVWMRDIPMWDSIIAELKKTQIADVVKQMQISDVVKQRESSLTEAEYEMELVAYFLQLSHYDRHGLLMNNSSLGVDLELAAQIQAIFKDATTFNIPGVGSKTLGDIAIELERQMLNDKISNYAKPEGLWDLLPNRLRTTIGAKVKGTTLDNIDGRWIYQVQSTKPSAEKILHDALKAHSRGDENWIGFSGHNYRIKNMSTEQVTKLVQLHISKESKALEVPVDGFAEMITQLTGEETKEQLFSIASSTFKAWSPHLYLETKEEKADWLTTLLERMGYDMSYDKENKKRYDGVLTKKQLMDKGIPIAAIPKEGIVLVHNQGTPDEHYSIAMMTGEHLGGTGDGSRTALAKGSYLANNVGGRLALKGAVLAMALKKAMPKARIGFVSVVSASSGQNNGDPKPQRHLMSDLLTQVQLVLFNDKKLVEDMEGGLNSIVSDASLMNPESYFGNVFENLYHYAQTVGSRMSKDGGKKFWADTTEVAASVKGGDRTQMEQLKTDIRGRINWLKYQVHKNNSEDLARNREYQQLLELYRVLGAGGQYTPMTTTPLSMDRQWIHDATNASNPLMVQIRDVVEVGLNRVRTALTIEVEWMEAQTRALDAKYKVLSNLRDTSDKLFGPMMKTTMAVDKDGNQVMVNMNMLHIDPTDPETAKALADTKSGLTMEHVALAKAAHDRLVAELAIYLESTNRDLGKENRKAKALELAQKMLKGGVLPAMPRRSEAALSVGDFKDSVALSMNNLLNMDAPSEAYFDPNATLKQGSLQSTLWEQLDESGAYSMQRLRMMGLVMNDNGGLTIVDAAKQRNVTKNLKDIYQTSINHSIRARMLKEAATTAQIGLDILRGLQYSGKDTTAQEQVIQVYADRILLGTLPKSKEISIAGHLFQIDKFFNFSARMAYTAALAFAPLVQAKSIVSSAVKLLASAVINAGSKSGLFGASALGTATASVATDTARVEAVNRIMQVVGRGERDLMNHMMHNVTQKHGLNQDIAMVGTYYGDYYAKLIGMVAQLQEEGIWDTLTVNQTTGELEYDESKDPRWKTKDGEIIRQAVLQARIDQGLQKHGDTKLTMPYDVKEMHRLRTIVERYAGETNDVQMKTLLQGFGLGRAALTMRSYIQGVIKTWYRPGEVEDLMGGRVVVDGKPVWVGRPMEGILQTLGNTLIKVRDLGKGKGWKEMTPWQRRNILLLSVHAAVIGLLIYALKQYLDEEDDEEEGSYGEKAFEYTVVNGLGEQLAIGNPYMIWNDVLNNDSAITQLWFNAVSGLWETLSLPYTLLKPDELTPKTHQISKKNTTASEDMEHALYSNMKWLPYGGGYRGLRTLYTDFIVGEGNKD